MKIELERKPWGRPVAEPIRCFSCGAPLDAEELEFYESHCERCTVALHKILQDDLPHESPVA